MYNKGGGEAVCCRESQLVSDGTLMGQQCFGVELGMLFSLAQQVGFC